MDPQSGLFLLIERVYEHELLVPLAQVIQEGMEAGEIAPGDVEALAVAIAALMDSLILYSVIWPEFVVELERLEDAAFRILQLTGRASDEIVH